MQEQKHFSYEGHVDLRKQKEIDGNLRVTGVEFLTPARVTMVVDGTETSVMTNIDIINRKVYGQNGDTILTEQVFKFLDSVNTLPEDFFQAPDEVYQKASEAEAEAFGDIHNMIGEDNE